MDFNSLNLAGFFQPVLFAKIVTLVIIALYAIFSFVIYTQVRVMNHVVSLPNITFALKMVTIVNIIIAISLFLLAIVIL